MVNGSHGLLANGKCLKEESETKKTCTSNLWRYWIPWRCHSRSLESSGFVQILLFSWLNHIIHKGLKKTLEQEDLGECPETLKSKQALKKLKTIIKEQEQKHGKRNISLFWIYMRLISTKITATFFVTLANIIVEFFCAAVFVRKLMEFLERGDLSMESGVYHVAVLSAMYTLRSCFKNLLMFLSSRTGVFAKSAFLGLIYDKAIKLKNSGNQSAGELVNLCANDTQRIMECTMHFVQMIALPIIILLVTSYLCVYFGPASLVGSALLLCYMPLQILFGKVFIRLRTSVVKVTDKRVKMISEVLTSIKLIKMYAWEESFARIIYGLRKQERKNIMNMGFAQGLTFSFGFVLVLLAHLLSIMTHIALGNELIVSKAFTLIVLYNQMTLYVTIGPIGIRSLAEVLVTFERIKKLLNLKEHESINETCIKSGYVVELEDVSFAWGKQTYNRTKAQDF